ncbi:MAG: UDP-N-acetylglucosamine 2-epimerase (non-hydrolyzing), partial [Rhodothermales bacterium]
DVTDRVVHQVIHEDSSDASPKRAEATTPRSRGESQSKNTYDLHCLQATVSRWPRIYSGMLNLLSVVGTRPNFIKVGPVHWAAAKLPTKVSHQILHTGQHYSPEMSDIFFRQLGLPEPDVYMGLGGGSHAEQTAKIMVAFEEHVSANRPDVLLVYGDVNSTMACALVAAKQHIPLVHVESGLRSGDRTMPEEINRLVTDSISDLLLVSEPAGMANLAGLPEETVVYVGNVMIDSLMRFRARAEDSNILEEQGLQKGNYVLATLHRPATVDNKAGLSKVLDILGEVAEKPVLFPIHPRTRKNLATFGLQARVDALANLRLIDPIGYIDFLRLQMDAELVITDSGGIQEETTFLNVPCLTLRPNTERPVTVSRGTNELLPLDAEIVADRVAKIRAGEWKQGQTIDGWDGRAGDRVISAVLERFG